MGPRYFHREAKWVGEVEPSGVPSWDRVGEAPGRRDAEQKVL